MPRFSEKSLRRLAECDARLGVLFNEVIRDFDCSIICGRRSNSEQARLFNLGLSLARPGESKHNVESLQLSAAVDVYPYPHEESDVRRFYYFCGFVNRVISQLGLPIRGGVDWYDELKTSRISDRSRHTFDDLAHWEIAGPRTC